MFAIHAMYFLNCIYGIHLTNAENVPPSVAAPLPRCGAEMEKAIARCLEPMLAYANALQLADQVNEHRHFSLQGHQVFRRLCALHAKFKVRGNFEHSFLH